MRTQLSLRDCAIGIALALICCFFAIQSPQFLSSRNLSLLVTELSITATLAMGMLLVILPGHIDLSAGSGVGLLGGIASVLVFEHQVPAPLALGAGLLAGLLIWSAMGALIIREKIPAFIITLGGLLVFKGLFWLVIHNATIPVTRGGQSNLYSLLTTFHLTPFAGFALASTLAASLGFLHWKSWRSRKPAGTDAQDAELSFLKFFLSAQLLFLFVLINNQYRGVPLSALLLGGVALSIHVLTTHTPFGRYLYAIGGNEEAALVSGIPVKKVVLGAYTLMGAIVALTGFMQTAYAGASTTTVGELMELDAVAACVIGGASLKGGRGTVLGVLMGALLMAVLLNGMTLLAVSPEFKFIARGSVLALAVWGDIRLARN
jgi:D-xylose transport system permease protein